MSSEKKNDEDGMGKMNCAPGGGGRSVYKFFTNFGGRIPNPTRSGPYGMVG